MNMKKINQIICSELSSLAHFIYLKYCFKVGNVEGCIVITEQKKLLLFSKRMFSITLYYNFGLENMSS